MKNILPVVGLMALAYSIYKNVTQDKEISLLKNDLGEYKKALKSLQDTNVVSGTYQISMKKENPVTFPKDIMIERFDARKNSTVSAPSTIIKL